MAFEMTGLRGNEARMSQDGRDSFGGPAPREFGNAAHQLSQSADMPSEDVGLAHSPLVQCENDAVRGILHMHHVDAEVGEHHHLRAAPPCVGDHASNLRVVLVSVHRPGLRDDDGGTASDELESEQMRRYFVSS
jgi:hypothetical protein